MITAIVNAITSAFTTLLSGIGSGIVEFFETIFLDSTSTASTPVLTTFASVALVFVGVGAAWGVVRWITGKVNG